MEVEGVDLIPSGEVVRGYISIESSFQYFSYLFPLLSV